VLCQQLSGQRRLLVALLLLASKPLRRVLVHLGLLLVEVALVVLEEEVRRCSSRVLSELEALSVALLLLTLQLARP
jgi:hypothetical protein